MTKIAGTGNGDGARSEAGSGSISQRPGSADTDPYQIKLSRIRNTAGFVTYLSQAERLKLGGMMVTSPRVWCRNPAASCGSSPPSRP
jgi:hypothetical protein